MKPIIKPVTESDLPQCLEVIRKAFGTVAAEFGLTRENAPTHPSFMEMRHLEKMALKGIAMLGLWEGSTLAGFVALEKTGERIYTMERLAVDPDHRHKGYGRLLVEHIFETVRLNGGECLSIGVIDENRILRHWYEELGFYVTETKTFSHLPFTVSYMEWRPEPEKRRGKPFLLFDLGGVLYELTGVSTFIGWLDGRLSLAEFSHKWLHSEAVRQYETGRLTQQEFAGKVISEFGFQVGEKEFLKGLHDFIKGPYPGCEDLLRLLKRHYEIGLLSNTNEAHWDRVCRESQLDRLFPMKLLSYQTGWMKPDREAFDHAIQTIGRPASQIYYFDDNPVNVQQALAAGLKAFCVTGDHLKEKLKELGLIPLEAENG